MTTLDQNQWIINLLDVYINESSARKHDELLRLDPIITRDAIVVSEKLRRYLPELTKQGSTGINPR